MAAKMDETTAVGGQSYAAAAAAAVDYKRAWTLQHL
jgi:hypothetical protein